MKHSIQHTTPPVWLTDLEAALLMGLPYLLLRLLADFADVRWPLVRAAEIGVIASVLALVLTEQPYPIWLTLLLVAYFEGLSAYDAVAFAARRCAHELQASPSHAESPLAGMPLDEMIAGQAFASQQRVFSTHAAQDDPVHAADYQAYGAVAILAAPITAGQIRLGVLSMYGPPPRTRADNILR